MTQTNTPAQPPAATASTPPSPTDLTLVIFGASGDLTHRLLLPGLGTLVSRTSRFAVTVIGAAMDDLSQEAWQERVRDSLASAKTKQARADDLLSRTRYVKIDVTNPDEMRPFVEGLPANTVLYFALPPSVTQKACTGLVGAHLPENLKFALEKPFGTSQQSAAEFNALLAQLVPEHQIFRVDHFLGKGTVMDLLALRFTNKVFDPIWNRDHIESVQIVVDESLALEGRAGYYDHNGALKDMIQSHLMQVMALVAMEEVSSIDERQVRDLIAHTLRATELWTGDPVTSSRRARYVAGSIDGKPVPSYVDEQGVDPANNTETLAEVDLRINNQRWAGVKFTLRSGKALGDMRNGITVLFRPIAHIPTGFRGDPPQNVLYIGMKPQTLVMQLSTNAGGEKFDLSPTILEADFADGPLRPYGEILEEIFDGNPILSVRGDVAEECWRIVAPVLDAWASGKVPMDEYAAGWAGPTTWN